jgi:hypothetical protein
VKTKSVHPLLSHIHWPCERTRDHVDVKQPAVSKFTFFVRHNSILFFLHFELKSKSHIWGRILQSDFPTVSKEPPEMYQDLRLWICGSVNIWTSRKTAISAHVTQICIPNSQQHLKAQGIACKPQRIRSVQDLDKFDCSVWLTLLDSAFDLKAKVLVCSSPERMTCVSDSIEANSYSTRNQFVFTSVSEAFHKPSGDSEWSELIAKPQFLGLCPFRLEISLWLQKVRRSPRLPDYRSISQRP